MSCIIYVFSRIGSNITNSTQVPIKGLPVDDVPLRIEAILPAHGYVRTPMPVSFELHNRSLHLLQLDMTMEASEAFMFAGYKQVMHYLLLFSV